MDVTWISIPALWITVVPGHYHSGQRKPDSLGANLSEYNKQAFGMRDHEIICVAATSPSSVMVLLSALAFHQIGTQQPHKVWIQIEAKGRVPDIDWPKLRVVRTRVSDLFEIGVETHQLGGQNVKITNPARTVADCFKHRNKLGLEVCIEAAREAVRGKKATVSDMAEMAKQLRVLSLMQPYLEVI